MSKQIEVYVSGHVDDRAEYFNFEELAKIFCISTDDDLVPYPLRFESIINPADAFYLVIEFLNGERRFFIPGITQINFV